MSFDSSSSSFRMPGPREIIVEEFSDSDASIISSSTDDDLGDMPKNNLPPEYWHIQKLVKYMKSGNQTATVVALCCLKDHDLSLEINQVAIQDIGGLEVLINLLDTKDLNCKLGSLAVLRDLTQSAQIRRAIVDLGAIQLLVNNLSDPARDLQILVAETIHNIAMIRKSRLHVRKCGGIPKLVDLLDVNEVCLTTPWEELSYDDKEFVHIARAAARALWSVAISIRNIKALMKSGGVPPLARLLKAIHTEVTIPAAGAIARCCNEISFQIAVETEGMLQDTVRHLLSPEAELRRYAAEIIFKCAANLDSRDQVREAGGLDPLVDMVLNPITREDKFLLAAVTGAVWKTAISKENVERYDQLKTVQALVALLDNVEENEQVLSNVVGGLSECLKFEHNRETLRRAGGIKHLVNLLNYTYPPLLENVPKVLKECAKEEESMRIIEDLDGVRLIWSLLKNESPRVQANAAWSLVPCVKNAFDSGELVRCFVGGLELIVMLLKSLNTGVLSGVCAAIAEIAKDRENLGIMTDHGVVSLLVNLVNTQDDLLREHLASAIAYCCNWGSNCKMFGRLGAITPLVGYMASSNTDVHQTTSLALFHLSKNPFNCITMHESGVVPFLLKTVASTDELLQESSAGCLANIRKLALEAEGFHLVTRGEKKVVEEEEEDEYF